jgi:hypothetical protein
LKTGHIVARQRKSSQQIEFRIQIGRGDADLGSGGGKRALRFADIRPAAQQI